MDMKKFIKKGCCGCLTASVVLFILILSFGIASVWIWPEAWGYKDLGNGICLIDADGYPIIVKGSERGGSNIIPSFEDYSTDQGVEYVDGLKYSDDWLIVKTLRKQPRYKVQTEPSPTKYYILDKRFEKGLHPDSILANYVTCYTDSISFADACKERGVDVLDLDFAFPFLWVKPK